MDFVAVVDQVIALLRQRGRLTYGTLKRQFQLDDAALEDLKEELIYGQRLAMDEDERVLVWIGDTAATTPPASGRTPALDTSPVRAPLAYTPPHLAEKILTSRRALEGERKQVTVLFADLKGSMELLAERDPEEARQLLGPVLERMMAAALGAAYTLSGRVADAVPLLTQMMEQSVTTGRVLFATLCRLSLGEAQVLAGRLEEANALAERALAHAREHQDRGHQAYALHLLGEIAVRRDPPQVELAATHYQQALALATELGMRPLQAHCHRGLGTLYAATAQRQQARTALTTAIDLYRAMEMTFWLPQTEAALVQGQ